jgi:formylglycine-generating enzyme required for sulfatase activity
MSFRVIEPGEFSMEIPAVTNKTAVELTRERIEAWARGEPPPPIKERPHRTVRLTKAYAVGLRAVTAGEFEKVMGRPAEHQSRDWRVHGNPDLPAAGVSWEEAAEFCRRLSERAGEKDALRRYRLPTEAEWSRAVEVEACCDPGARWNLLPIHWAVWEWCSDWFDEGYHREMPAVDPAGPPAGESHLARLAWSHADPFVDQYTFRVVAESP